MSDPRMKVGRQSCHEGSVRRGKGVFCLRAEDGMYRRLFHIALLDEHFIFG